MAGLSVADTRKRIAVVLPVEVDGRDEAGIVIHEDGESPQ